MTAQTPSSAPSLLCFSSIGRPGLSCIVVLLFWTSILSGLGIWHYTAANRAFTEHARTAARYSLQKDMTYRTWASTHGRVYVPATKENPPSDFLEYTPERDVLTPSGMLLTLLHPNEMIRQVHELPNPDVTIISHLTSLDPLRPEGVPDAWEKEALIQFQQGVSEWSALTTKDDRPYLRLMQPLLVEKSCLGCHTTQNYEVGDLLGGISVSIPWLPYREALHQTIPALAFGYSGVWFLGLVFLYRHRQRLVAYLTAQQQVQDQLKESREHFQAIFNGVNDVIFLHDYATGEIIDINDRFTAVYGYSREEARRIGLQGLNTGTSSYTLADATHYFEQARLGETPTFEWRARHRDGSLFWTEVTIRKANIHGKPMLLATVRNIDERKQSEDLLAQQSQDIKQRNMEMERFNYTVSHDLKTPLVTIETFLGFLQADLKNQDAPAIDKDIGYIRSATGRMAELLDSLLRIAKVGHISDTPEKMTFNELLADVMTLVAGNVSTDDIHIDLSDNDLLLFGDRVRLIEIWQNLIDNAIKYRGEQSQTIIEVGLEQQNGETVFFVRDNGMGIDPNYREKIFGMFDQLDKNSSGSGLGLALVKRVVEIYGGHIWVESQGPGTGSCFYFTLPDALSEGESDKQ